MQSGIIRRVCGGLEASISHIFNFGQYLMFQVPDYNLDCANRFKILNLDYLSGWFGFQTFILYFDPLFEK